MALASLAVVTAPASANLFEEIQEPIEKRDGIDCVSSAPVVAGYHAQNITNNCSYDIEGCIDRSVWFDDCTDIDSGETKEVNGRPSNIYVKK